MGVLRNGQALKLLLVCTGNVVRSPLAALTLRARLGAASWADVASAGLHANEGQRMTAEAIRLVERLGGDPDAAREHTARRLTAAEANAAGLILVMTRAHRRAVAELAPRRLHMTFTVGEFSRLLKVVDLPRASEGADVAARMSAAITALSDQRPRGVDAEDIVDPFGGGADLYRRCAEQLVPAVTAVSDFLTSMSPSGGVRADPSLTPLARAGALRRDRRPPREGA